MSLFHSLPILSTIRFLSVGILFAIAGCSHRPPATANDYRQLAQTNNRGRIETWQIDGEASVVADRLDQGFGACFNVTIQHCSSGYGGGCTPERHSHTIDENLDGSFTLTERMNNRSRGGSVPRDENGSLFQFVVDVAPADGGSVVTAYGMDNNYWNRLFNAAQGWATGSSSASACPNMQRSWSDLGRHNPDDIQPAPPPPTE